MNEKVNKPVFDGAVLLCEDNEMNQDVIASHFAKFGLKTVIAENGKEGAEEVQGRIKNGEKPFDLIFMDILMPVMDGFEATAEIIKLNTGTPIIALTAKDVSTDKEEYTACGMAGCIGKPFSSKELLDWLMKYLTPVSRAAEDEAHQAQSDEELRLKIIQQFVNNNKTKYNEITKAIDEGDIKLAHRLAHTLKSNAGHLCKTRLQEAAEEVENLLSGDRNRVTPVAMNILKIELEAVLKELAPIAEKICESRAAAQITAQTGSLDAKETRDLIEELETQLDGGSTECLKITGRLRQLPGSGELIQQIEDFQFDMAMETLIQLKKEWM